MTEWVGLRSDGSSVICIACSSYMCNGPLSVFEAEALEEDLDIVRATERARRFLEQSDDSPTAGSSIIPRQSKTEAALLAIGLCIASHL